MLITENNAPYQLLASKVRSASSSVSNTGVAPLLNTQLLTPSMTMMKAMVIMIMLAVMLLMVAMLILLMMMIFTKHVGGHSAQPLRLPKRSWS